MIDFKIIIANRIIQFKCGDKRLSYDAPSGKEFKDFIYTGARKPDVVLNIKYGQPPPFKGKKILFDVERHWTLSKWKEKILFEYPDRVLPGRMERTGVIDSDMKKGIIYANIDKTPEEQAQTWRLARLPRTKKRKMPMASIKKQPSIENNPEENNPDKLGEEVISGINSNFLQAFIKEYLVKKKIGFLIHSACIQHNGRSHLYMGPSRAGKSTIADLWADKGNAKILNDDRGILFVENEKLMFYTAPRGGRFNEKCNLKPQKKVKINKIFFIYHNKNNKLDALSQAEASTRMFKNSFPVFWNGPGLEYILNICAKAAGLTPCYKLGFMNDKSVVTFLKKKFNI